MSDKEDELRRFLAVAAAQEAKGDIAVWYWKEDEARMDGHDPATTFGKHWVRYADSVAAQMEFFWKKKSELRKNNGGEATLDVDVAGRVTSATDGNRGKAFASDTGTSYSINLDRMVQINARTGFERAVMRHVEQMQAPAGGTKTTQAPPGDNQAKTNMQKQTQQQQDDDQDAQVMDEDIPPFPADLVDARTGKLKEPLLRAKVGQLIQIQCKRVSQEVSLDICSHPLPITIPLL